jgi:hypothetical protein
MPNSRRAETGFAEAEGERRPADPLSPRGDGGARNAV